MKCDRCEKKHDELVTRHKLRQEYNLEWICKECFLIIENCTFDDYGIDLE